MMRGRTASGSEPRRAWRILTPALAAAMAAACTGETLYDSGPPPDTPIPAVAIVAPDSGAQVQAGRRVSVRVAAEDSLGVAEIEVSWRGAATGTITIPIVPPRSPVVLDTAFTVPEGVSGQLELRAKARNGSGGIAESAVRRIAVAINDTIAPNIAITSQVPARVELTDTLRFVLAASDNNGGSGLARIGLTALVTSPGDPDTIVVSRAIELGVVDGSVEREIAFVPPGVDERDLPKPLLLGIHAWAVDVEGNCGANVSAASVRVPCTTFRDATIAGAAAPQTPTRVVAGRSVELDDASDIPDIAVDPQRQHVFVSNLGRHRVDVLDIEDYRFLPPVLAGSHPWGLHMNRTGDTLLVANSGGTSISSLALQSGTPVEVISRRLETHFSTNVWIVERQNTPDGTRAFVSFIDFSDRPQHLAQDALGRLLFSTLPTPAAPAGTIRVAERQQGWEQAEVRLLLSAQRVIPDPAKVTILNIDRVEVTYRPGAEDLVDLIDHRSGFPSQEIRTGPLPLFAALDSLTNHPQSDIEWGFGEIDMTFAGLQDTTFVEASGNRMRVAFGEGDAGHGRVFMWDAPTATVSDIVQVADLVGNTAEHIFGLDLNVDGSFNVARGMNAAFYFKQDLRLQGHFHTDLGPGRSGAGLHPLHPMYGPTPPSGPNTLSFVASGNVVRIVDTTHYAERGNIEIRDNIIGPVEVSGPLPGENSGCAQADCIVARLYGVTDAGTVVIVPIRNRDIQ